MQDDDVGDKAKKRKPHETAPWYKRYPRSWIEDTRGLSLEERGAYNDIIDLIYVAEGPLKDDDVQIAYRLHVNVKVWRRIRSKLLAQGFLFITRGHLHQKRAKEVLAEREEWRRKSGRSGAATACQGMDLFGNPNDSNANFRGTSESSDRSDQESKKEDRSTEPLRVIEGGKTQSAEIQRYVSEEGLNKVKTLAPGWDRQYLLKTWMAWGSKGAKGDWDTAFLAWVPKYTKGKRPA